MIIELSRGQIGKSAGVDITVKSSKGMAKQFAPTWPMVMGHKNHTLTNEAYTAQYLKILDQLPDGPWGWLAAQNKNGHLTLLCYCPSKLPDGSPKFCHTHIIIDYMCKRWPSIFSKKEESHETPDQHDRA